MKKSEKGSISMIVFVTVMFMMIVLSTLSSKSKSQIVEQQKWRNTYDGDMKQAFEERNYTYTTNEIESEPGGGD